jgi:hypothetical protein
MVFCSLGILLVGLGVPIGLIVFVRGLALRGLLRDGRTLQTYGSVYSLYKDSHYFFDSVIMLRKFTLLLILTNVNNAIIQSVMNMVLSLIYLVFVVCWPPFLPLYSSCCRKPFEFANLSEQLCSFFVFVSHILAFAMSLTPDADQAVVAAFFLSTNALALLFVGVPLIVRLSAEVRSKRKGKGKQVDSQVEMQQILPTLTEEKSNREVTRLKQAFQVRLCLCFVSLS